jgi:CRP-like cAMP-binding protein
VSFRRLPGAAALRTAGQGRVELPQRTLAAMTGVQRPSLNKVLKDLERDGLIRIGYSSIEVLDRARLVTRP